MPFESTTLTIIALPAATSALYWLDVRLPLALKVYPITVRGIIIVDGLELETTDAELILAAPSAVIKVEPDPKFPVQFPVVSDAMAPVTYDDDAVVKVVVSEEVPGADEPLPPQATKRVLINNAAIRRDNVRDALKYIIINDPVYVKLILLETITQVENVSLPVLIIAV